VAYLFVAYRDLAENGRAETLDAPPLPRLKLVPACRLEDKIRHLCALAAVANDDDAWLVLSELRILLRRHVEYMRMVAAGKLSGTREFLERRSDPINERNELLETKDQR
jgi:hypothetical protein